MSNGDLVAAGMFSGAGGTPASRIARWNGSTGSALGTGMGGVSPGVQALALLGTDIIAGGYFTTAGGNTVNRIARWDGANWSAFVGSSIGVNADVLALTVSPGGDLIAGGEFSNVGGTPASRVARWVGLAWSALGTGLTGTNSTSLVFIGSDLYAGGQFSMAGGNPANDVAVWNGSTWSAVGAGTDGSGSGIAPIPGGVVVGGGFDHVGTARAENIGVWNGSEWSAVANGLDASVTSLAVRATGELILGGSFISVGETALNRVASWDGLGFNPVGSGFDVNTVWDLAVGQDDTVFAVGNFTMAGVEYTKSIARWNDGLPWFRVGTLSDANNQIQELLTLANGDIVAAGSFSFLDGSAYDHIARWDGTQWNSLGSPGIIPTALAQLPNGNIVAASSVVKVWDGASWITIGTAAGPIETAMVLSNGDLLIGGGFLSVSGVTAHNIARWNGVAWSAFGGGLNGGAVYSIVELPSGEIVAGGYFDDDFSAIARWDGAAWQPLGVGISGVVRAVALLPNGELAAAGIFSSAGNFPNANFARWSFTGIPTIRIQPEPQSGNTGDTLTLTAAASRGYTGVSFQWQRDGVDIADGPGGASAGGGDVSGASASLTSPTDGLPVSLTITGVQPSDSGTYTVVFTSKCGDVESVEVLVGISGGSKCPADFDGNGIVNSTDVGEFINAWFQDQVDGTLISDWDNNGIVNSTDVGEFINSWFEDIAAGCG